MSVMANTTPIVATVMKPATKEKTPKDADATPRVDIQDFCEEHYEDILLVIMDKIRCDNRKEVHARLDFEESPKKRRIREGSQNSSAKTLSARYRNPSERLKVRDRLRYNDRHVLDRLGHRRANSMDRSYSRSRPHRRDSSNRDRSRSRDCSRGVEESYDNTRSSYGMGTKHGYRSRNRDRSHYVKRGRGSESPLSRVSEGGTNEGRHWKSKSKRHKSTDEDDLAVPWICEEVDPFTPRIRNFKSSRKTQMPNNVKTYDGTGDLEDHVKNFQAVAQIDVFHAYKVPVYASDFGPPYNYGQVPSLHEVNNPELTKRLNEHVPKTMEEMMIATTAFIRGKAAAVGKKKGHASWRAHDQSKRHALERRSDFRGQPREGRGSSRWRREAATSFVTSIMIKGTARIEEDGLTWMTPIIEYLKEGTLPEDKKEASKLRIKARQYELWEGVLYRRSFLKPWLWCVGPLQADNPLTPITAPWPFYKWGIDIAGPFSEGPEKVNFFIVIIVYFTKWIEAKAVSTITGNQVKKFVRDNIVCGFGLSGEIVSDNGKQFSDNLFKDWCEKLNITQRFASVKHPQSNGLVERANRSLGDGIKARLGEGNKNWIKELPHILWAHRMTIKSSHGDTPFSLTYGTKAVIPVEIGMPTYRTTAVDAVHNDEELQLNLDLLEERRERAAIHEAKVKLQMTKYYNARVRGVTFRP
ncbi:reverse transcriptase domain-containing protein [Tanacetum coccineum]|uniref:Reverse transcriptase domain-containing protein n=1 Tax=Tanacetum coccineum TaxID=301880 RepID=A0ABQ5I020_9ASTR